MKVEEKTDIEDDKLVASKTPPINDDDDNMSGEGNSDVIVEENSLTEEKTIESEESPTIDLIEDNTSEPCEESQEFDMSEETENEENSSSVAVTEHLVVEENDIKQVDESVDELGMEELETELDDGLPFVVEEKLKPVNAVSGEKTNLSITLSKPAREFKWFVNNVEISPDNPDYKVESSDSTYTITFLNCSLKDDKKSVKYVAKCFDKQLTDSVRIKVKPAVPELKSSSRVKDLYEIGEDIKLEVDVKGHSQPYQVNWSKGFRKVNEEEGKTEFVVEDNHVMLVIKNVDVVDAGTYKCTVKSSTGSTELKFNPIKIKKPADKEDVIEEAPKSPETTGSEFGKAAMQLRKTTKGGIKLQKSIENDVEFEIEEKMKPVVSEDGDEAVFTVQLTKEAERVIWLINDEEVVPMDDILIECQEKRKYFLTLKNCSMNDDKTTIKFIAKLNEKEVSGSVKLKVQPVVPAIKLVKPAKEVYQTGENAEFSLLIKGHPEPFEIVWYKGFKKLTEEEDKCEVVVDGNNVSLLLRNLDSSDAATYKCVVNSSVCTSEFKFPPIKIKEKTNSRVFPKDGSNKNLAGNEIDVDDDNPVLSKTPSINDDDDEKLLSEETSHVIVEENASTEEKTIEYEESPAIDLIEKDTSEVCERSQEIDMLEETENEENLSSVATEENSVVEESDNKQIDKSVDELGMEELETELDDGLPFVVEEKLKPVNAVSGEKTNLSITLSKPAREFKWFVNNVEISPDNPDYKVESSDSTYTITFLNCSLKDDKKSVKYVAKCFDKQLTDSVRIKVKPAVPELKSSSRVKDLYEIGEDIKLEVDVKGHSQPYQVNWSKGFRKVNEEEGKTEFVVEDNHVMLVIKNVDVVDAGTYKCTVKSSTGSTELKFNPIKIKKPADKEDVIEEAPKSPETTGSEFGKAAMQLRKTTKGGIKLQKSIENDVEFEIEEKMKPVVSEDGDEAVFTVQLTKEAESFIWLINDEEVVPMDNIVVECEDKSHTLFIKECSLDDDKKNIKFIAKLGDNEVSNSVKLRVQRSPPSLKPFSSIKEVYCLGDRALFELSVKGHQEPYNVTWFNGFKRLSNKIGKVEMTVQKSLVSLSLSDLDRSNGGTYKCVIRSSTGTSEFKFIPIKVKEKIEYEKWRRTEDVTSTSSSRDIFSSPSQLVGDVEPVVRDAGEDVGVVDINNNNEVDTTEKEETDKEKVPLLVGEQQTSFDSLFSGDDAEQSISKRNFSAKHVTRETDEPLLAIIEKLKPIVVECGDDATFSVVLVGDVQQIVWFVNKIEIEGNSNRTIVTSDSDNNKFSLILKNCSLDDNKTSVRFTAVSGDEEVSGSSRLKVQPAEPALKAQTITKEEYHVGDEIPFVLSIRGHQEPYEIVWYNGFKKILQDEDKFEIVADATEVSLLVKNAELSDAGTYKCVLKSSAATSEFKYEPIRIKEKLGFNSTNKTTADREQKLAKRLSDRDGVEASNDSFENEEVIAPVVEHEVAAIPKSDVNSFPEPSDRNGRSDLLFPKKSKRADEETSNDVPFTITEKMKPVVGESGESITFSVGLSSEPDQIKWYINNIEIGSSSTDYIIENKDGKCSFTISKCSMEDDKKALKYIAKCHDKELSGSIRLKIQPAPPGLKQTSVLRDCYEEGDEVRLEVEVKGHPEPYFVNWYKGYKAVSYVEGRYEFVNEKNVATFILEDVRIADAGSYKCVVKSSKTTTELKFKSFKVKGLTININHHTYTQIDRLT